MLWLERKHTKLFKGNSLAVLLFVYLLVDQHRVLSASGRTIFKREIESDANEAEVDTAKVSDEQPTNPESYVESASVDLTPSSDSRAGPIEASPNATTSDTNYSTGEFQMER